MDVICALAALQPFSRKNKYTAKKFFLHLFFYLNLNDKIKI